MAQQQDQPQNSSGMDIPDYAIEQMARCMLSLIRSYYESEEGQRELAKWKSTQEEQ